MPQTEPEAAKEFNTSSELSPALEAAIQDFEVYLLIDDPGAEAEMKRPEIVKYLEKTYGSRINPINWQNRGRVGKHSISGKYLFLYEAVDHLMDEIGLAEKDGLSERDLLELKDRVDWAYTEAAQRYQNSFSEARIGVHPIKSTAELTAITDWLNRHSSWRKSKSPRLDN